VLVATKRVEPSRDESTDVTTDDDTSCFTTHVPLEEHSAGVRDQARSDAQRCGLPPTVCDDLGLAGWGHDVGKADPRCQLWLYGGDRVALEGAGALLAKSGLSRHQMAVRRARERSGYLVGTRHELLSVALIDGCTALRAAAHDWELVLHLVASHHGYCRPLAPVGPDLPPVPVRLRHGSEELSATSAHGLERLDSGIADRFWTLVARYGWYSLAYLEALLRLADWRRSELEMP
jgi:CRISPR-associated endonuclease/helicase Cas3